MRRIGMAAAAAAVLAQMGIGAEVVSRESRVMRAVSSAIPVVGVPRSKPNGGHARKRAIREARLRKFRPR